MLSFAFSGLIYINFTSGKKQEYFSGFLQKNVSQFSELCYIYKHKKI